jgi:ubiquinol-cytochrome c reductase iron-sulfur subunit
MSASPATLPEESGQTRRDFITLTAFAFAGIGGAATIWPFVSSLNPAADTLAMASSEQDLSAIAEGQSIKLMWRGKPVFVRHRTQAEIDAARKDDTAPDLKDPATDESRVKKGHEKWLVAVGVCTHLGCVPLANAGEYNGWFCPCHGSHYDTSGRIRKGPAPTNLLIPEYEFTSDTHIVIGGKV